MTNNNDHPYESILSELDYQMTLTLVRGLVDEFSSEMQIHHDDARLREMRDDDSVQILIEAGRFLRKHEVPLPEAFVHLLLIVSEISDPE